MNEKDLENINLIDMECSGYDDDDTFTISDTSAGDDREVQSKTGIIINLNDDDDNQPMRAIKADISMKNPKSIDITSDFTDDTFTDYNAIDMETTSWDEDDDDYRPSTKKTNPIFIDIDEPAQGLIASDMIEESKKSVSFGDVEDDYWEKLSKKHKKTNKKGAYNTSFHFAGNPKQEQDMFNHMMGISNKTDTSHIVQSDSLLAASAEGSGSTSISSGNVTGVGEGCCEELSKNSYSSKLSELFDIIGFEVFKNSDNSYTAIDKCDILPSFGASNLKELISVLKPYLDDCLIYPLQVATNTNLDTYKDWADWYTVEMQQQFPKCASDIEYCDLLANHLDECLVE